MRTRRSFLTLLAMAPASPALAKAGVKALEGTQPIRLKEINDAAE
jgi:hypothetical protein